MNFARHQSDYMVSLHDRARVLENQQAINEEYFTTLSDDSIAFLKNLDVSSQDTNILIGDNSSESFAIVEGVTPYMTFDTTNSSERIICAKPLVNTNTTQSTNKDTGCLILEGGIGIEKNANVGGSLSVNSTTQSSSISSGSIVTSGGLGVAKNAYFGGSLVEKYTSYTGLVDAQTITIDLASGNNIHLTFGGSSRTILIDNPINGSSAIGQSGFIIIDLNGTNNVVQWGDNWKFKTSPLASTISTIDVVRYYVLSSTRILCNYETDVNNIYEIELVPS